MWRFPWQSNEDEDETLRRLHHIAAQNSRIEAQGAEILRLLRDASALMPNAVHLLAQGVPMPATITATETQVVYGYTETRAGEIVPNVGTPAFSIDADPSVASGVDNGDGTFTVTRAGAQGGTANVNLSVTLPDGSVLNAEPDALTVDAQLPDAVQLAPGTPS